MTDAMAIDPPRYKPYSKAAEAVDISTNEYGASSLAPGSLGIGELAPDFRLPLSGGGQIHLSSVASTGPVVLIFYRGHW